MTKRDQIVQAALDRCPAEIGTPSYTKVPCGYVMGATGWVCTQARLDAQAKQYPAYAAKIRQYGPRWLGKKCYDCAQLVRVSALAAGVKMVSGANSQWTKTDWAERGTIDTLPADSRGLFLYRLEGGRAQHTAVSIGDGTEAEALGHAYGVVRRQMPGSFTHWARLQGLDEGGDPTMPTTPTTDHTHDTIRRGAKGLMVIEMQACLLVHGVPLPRYGADGDFGAETEAAVKTFQGLHGLVVDGVCGPVTWAALLAEPEVNPPADDPATPPVSDPVATYTFTVPGITAAQAMAECDRLRGVYGACEMAVG